MCFSVVYYRHLEVFWPNKSALLDCNSATRTIGDSLLNKNTTGKLVVEIPLATRHIGNVEFEYDVSVNVKSVE